MSSNNTSNGFSPEQQNYLQGFMLGADVARTVRGLPILSGSCGPSGTTIAVGANSLSKQMTGSNGSVHKPELPCGPERLHYAAQKQVTDAGKKLSPEEKAKWDKHPFDMWDELLAHAREGRFPKGTDVFLFKYHGIFFVSPVQNAYMCRMRIPGGELKSFQLRGLADLSDKYANGTADVTTRANLQFRDISAENGVNVILGLMDLGIIIRGSGADNIRNVTASPTSGLDPQELIETLPLAKQMHHFILQHKEMYGLPRKFNIAFDGGGTISSLDETNDIGFTAVKVSEVNATGDVPAGVYFRLTLGGITGHLDFARDTGYLVRPEQCLDVARAIVKVFSSHGDRTDRKKARLKYVLDAWGFEKFIAEVSKELKSPLLKFDVSKCDPRPAVDRKAHVGVHTQKQQGTSYIGLILPVGKLTSAQLRSLASLADRFGSGSIRLTVWQNLIIPDIADTQLDAVKAAIEEMGLEWSAHSVRSNLIACTGSAGCKYAGADTKRNALELAAYLEERIDLDVPINIHFTGCHHSCAQHYIGDIGMIGTKVEMGDDMVDGYHVFVGGGYEIHQGIGRELLSSVPADEIPIRLLPLLEAYLEHRHDQEPFVTFTRRHTLEELRDFCTTRALANV